MNISDLLEKIEEQETQLVFEHFNHAAALDIGVMLAKRVSDSTKPVAIRIYIGEVIVFQYSMEGKEESHYDWIRRKRNVVLATNHSSMYARLEWQFLGKHKELAQDAHTYGFGCGAVPIKDANGTIRGVIGISGLPDPTDHLIVMEVLAKYRNIEDKKPPIEQIDWTIYPK